MVAAAGEEEGGLGGWWWTDGRGSEGKEGTERSDELAKRKKTVAAKINCR